MASGCDTGYAAPPPRRAMTAITNTDSSNSIVNKATNVARTRAFRTIERTAALLWRNSVSPATYRGLVFVAVAAIATIITDVAAWLFLSITAATFIFGYMTTPHKTWKEVLFDQLAKYSPANPGAYKRLQEQVQSSSTIQQQTFNFWAALEEEALFGEGTAQHDQLAAAKRRFLDRQV